MPKYNYLIIGAGLFGATFAREQTKRGKHCLVIDKRAHIGGNVYTEDSDGICVHVYGAHIFHTKDREVWDYVNALADFNRYTNSPLANFKGELYNLPFNMNTFRALWGVTTPREAAAKIESQRLKSNREPANLEEQALALVGTDIYEKLIKGYTEKQWGRDCRDLPAFIIRRLPVRFTFDNNYFNDRWQGIPIGGYTQILRKLLDGCDVRLCTDYFEHKAELDTLAEQIVYTGPLDAYFEYRFGRLDWRSLRFETETLDTPNFQGNAVINHTDRAVPFTRIVEHKHFELLTEPERIPRTVITREYPADYIRGSEPYYPVNDAANEATAERYRELARTEPSVLFGGRLADYRYCDMDKVIRNALDAVRPL
jgi:UDP-galactopyranose mutase